MFDAAGQHVAKANQRHLIDQNALRLHARQTQAERKLDLIIELFHTGFPDSAGQHFIECSHSRCLRPKRSLPRCFLPHLLAETGIHRQRTG